MINPIFIIGVPRSGTTLLRIILDSHSQIAGASETPWILGSYGPESSFRNLLDSLIRDKLGPVNNLPGIDEKVIMESGRLFLNRLFQAYLVKKKKQILKDLVVINKRLIFMNMIIA